MKDKIAIILPVRDGGVGRSERLMNCLYSYYKYTENLSDVHLLHDTDECNIYHIVSQVNPGIINHCIPAGLTLMEKINYNILEIAKDYKYVGFIGDDIRFETTFENKFIEYLSSKPHALAYGNDDYWKGALPTHPFITSKTILAVGFFGCPAVEHNFFDNYWQRIFIELRSIKYFPEVIMNHYHPVAGKELPDLIYYSIQNKLKTDEQKFLTYMMNNLSSDLRKIENYEI